MKVTRQLNIKDKEDHFFTDMINVNNFDPSLLHVNKTVVMILLFTILSMSKT